MRKSIVIASLAIVALGCAAVIALPAYIQHRAIEEAAAHGISLTIDHTRLGFDGVHLEGVSATTVQIPNAKVHADEVTSTWDASSVVVDGGEVTIDGPVTLPNTSAPDNPIPASTAGPTTIHVQSAHISWTHVVGDTAVDLANVTGDFALAPHPGTTFDVSSNASLIYAARTIGPFSTQLSRDVNGDHARVAFDPANPNADTLSIDHAPTTGLERYEWTSDARPLSKLGIPLDLLGITVNGDPSVQLHVLDSVTRPANGAPRGNGTLSITTPAIQLPQVPDPAPGSIDLSWSGNPDQPMPVTGGRFSAGPFSGAITGSIMRPVGAVAVDLAVTSNAVPCSKFTASDPLGSLLGGTSFGAIAAMTGAKSNVTGDVKLTGSAQFDSRNPGARRVSLAPTTTCGLSISLGSGEK